MPRSLSSRCHRASSGNLFTTPAPWWSCTLQMPIAFHWRSLQRHQLMRPCSKQGTLPRHGGEWWSRKSDLQEPQSQRTRRKSEGEQIPETGSWAVLVKPRQHWSWWQRSRTPWLLLPVWTKPVSPGMRLGEAHAILFHRGDTATAKEESEGDVEAISLWMHETQKVCLYFHCKEYCLFWSYTT